MGKEKFDIDKLISADKEQKRQRKKERKVITLRDYLDLVTEDPAISQLSPLRIKSIFDHYGFEDAPEEWHKFGIYQISKLVRDKWQLYGPAVHKATMDFYNWLGSGPPTEQMSVVFVGPTASGKSTWVMGLMRELENYNLKPVYGIKDCPLPGKEEPLNAIPRYMRRRTFDKYKATKAGLNEPIEDMLGIADIEGDLCPHCRRHFIGWTDSNENYHPGKHVDEDGVFNWDEIEVEMFTFSVQGRRGIGSFEPSGEKTQDESDLTAKKRMAVVENPKKGYGAPDAFDFSGALFQGNRGITEAREIFKVGIDDKILWVFINVAAEKQVKVQGSTLPHVFVDTVTIGHCNLNGYKDFSNDRGQEGMHSRFYVIPFPYSLRVKDEVRIYNKLINQKKDFGGLKKAHIAPGALKLAALAVQMSRYIDPESGVSLLSKAKAYNGEENILVDLEDDEKNPVTSEDLFQEGQEARLYDIAKVEGMFGIDSRDALAALNVALAKEAGDNGCLTPLKAIKAMRELFDHRMGHDPESIDRFLDLLNSEESESVITEYYEFIKDRVARAFLSAYDDQAREMFDRYLEEIRYYTLFKNPRISRGKGKLRRDPVTNKLKEPDEKFMRSIEKHMGTAESEKDVQRTEILSHESASPDFDYDSYEPLRKAIDKKLLKDAAPLLRAVLSTDKPKDEKEKKRSKDLFDSLLEEGFCEVCAKETVEQAAPLFSE